MIYAVRYVNLPWNFIEFSYSYKYNEYILCFVIELACLLHIVVVQI